MKSFLLLLPFFTSINFVKAQTPANLPKDAKIEGTIVNMRTRVPLVNELIIFKSSKNSGEYQVISDQSGKYSTRVPSGDKYEVFIMGFKDSTSKIVVDIPALANNAYYTNAFIVDLEHEPSKVFDLVDVEFDFAKATLKEESYPIVNDLVDYLTRKSTEKAEIGGHTDNIGTPARNKLLSLERAKTIVAYLVSKGIDPERLIAKGYGAAVPVASNKTEAGRQKNRRIEVKILE